MVVCMRGMRICMSVGIFPARTTHLLHSGNVLLGHHATLDLRDEFEVGRGPLLVHVRGLELHLDARELTGAARLLLVGVVHLGIPRDGLTVRNLHPRTHPPRVMMCLVSVLASP